ncbi:hypothetical protein ACFQY5_41345 [Paeniroseomonas aquatica]|uniref:hypothetical protein n=1 Tax=Paeniroseomonas aquatica TaxID=373043 RepID=UPI003606EB3E
MPLEKQTTTGKPVLQMQAFAGGKPFAEQDRIARVDLAQGVPATPHPTGERSAPPSGPDALQGLQGAVSVVDGHQKGAAAG